MKNFYCVYEHIRPDTGVVFYVGKGRKSRSTEMKGGRNKHHLRIQAKLAKLSLKVEVRIIACFMDEKDAFAFERERVAFWRSNGVSLANMTDGGDGTSGWKHSKEWSDAQRARWIGKKHRPESIEKMRKSSTGIKHTEETKAKIALASSLKRHSRETKKKISLNSAHNKNWLGKAHRPETIEKMRQFRRDWWAQKKALSPKEIN